MYMVIMPQDICCLFPNPHSAQAESIFQERKKKHVADNKYLTLNMRFRSHPHPHPQIPIELCLGVKTCNHRSLVAIIIRRVQIQRKLKQLTGNYTFNPWQMH